MKFNARKIQIQMAAALKLEDWGCHAQLIQMICAGFRIFHGSQACLEREIMRYISRLISDNICGIYKDISLFFKIGNSKF